ncbi:hypothetical protein D1007_46965 [Hordeum vulgare]|nr:hypothetical protein D1007_46965 [Hordeum vulgare]
MSRQTKLADHDSELTKATAEQVAECGCLEALHGEVDESQAAHAKQVSNYNAKLTAWEEQIWANANAKAAADRATLSSLELTACQALTSICRLGLEFPSSL